MTIRSNAVERILRRPPNERRPDGSPAIGFTNDLSLLTAVRRPLGNRQSQIGRHRRVDERLRAAADSLEDGSHHAHHKSGFLDPVLMVEGLVIPVKRNPHYLGLQQNSHLTFSSHPKSVSSKASQADRSIGRLMPNLGGPSQP